MSQIQIAAMQAFLAMLQVINAGYATVSKNLMVALMLAGLAAGIQVFLQLVGNATMSPLHQAQVDQAASVMATQAAAPALMETSPAPVPAPVAKPPAPASILKIVP